MFVQFILTSLLEVDLNGLAETEAKLNLEEFDAPEWCVPIKANVLDFEWDNLAESCQFDVILMDPPWQLASHAPTRGVILPAL
jgi:mRNA (2'-O-methyladenosine-N6-)-methyltransferase